MRNIHDHDYPKLQNDSIDTFHFQLKKPIKNIFFAKTQNFLKIHILYLGR